jgi:hypothetical protein
VLQIAALNAPEPLVYVRAADRHDEARRGAHRFGIDLMPTLGTDSAGRPTGRLGALFA